MPHKITRMDEFTGRDRDLTFVNGVAYTSDDTHAHRFIRAANVEQVDSIPASWQEVVGDDGVKPQTALERRMQAVEAANTPGADS